ncbi:histone-lysine N-methyltransferase SETMAR [Trichonephila clavipes]|nr:histone-lysine N-methyltransferase SETMAR [Trichonephila clavipes]
MGLRKSKMSWILCMGTLHHHLPQWNFGQLNLNVVAELAGKWLPLQKKKILFHQDNAPSHTSAVAMAKIYELRFELLDHPPYSPDPAPNDFFLFPHLKIALGQIFSSNEEAVTFLNNYLADENADYYLDG